jgi:HTH-type transcriptional regulator, transcriptional repressor of NAD biosynthesis genes
MRPEDLPRIALLGGESSGKTTLAVALAARLPTLWVPEYGRVLWEALRTTLSAQQLVQVARTQVAWEHEHAVRALAQGARWLVCDTTPLTTLQYSLHDHGHAEPELHALAARRYALTVLCEPGFAFVQDGCRRDDGFRQAQHAWTLARLAERGEEPLRVSGSVDERVAQVFQRLATLPVPGDAAGAAAANAAAAP